MAIKIFATTEDVEGIIESFPILAEEPEETVYVLESSDIDATLTQSGKVADAAAVGEALNEKLNVSQSSVNVGKILVVGADGNLTLTDMPSLLSGDVVGMLDENNNIIITGELADGTYIFKYENTDGTYADIGSLTIGSGGAEITYTNLADTSAEAGWLNDKRFSTSNLSTETIKDEAGAIITNYIQINIGQTLRIKGIDCVNTTGSIVPVMARYNPKDTFITLRQLGSLGTYDAATNISEFTFSNSVILDGDYIRICGALVDGYTADDVIITLDEEIPEDNTGSDDENTSGYTNIIDTVGYTNDIRLSTNDGVSTCDAVGYVTTGLIDLSSYDGSGQETIVRTKGVIFNYDSHSNCMIYTYNADGSFITAYALDGTDKNGVTFTIDNESNLTLTYPASGATSMRYFRLTGYGNGANLIVTVNEELPNYINRLNTADADFASDQRLNSSGGTTALAGSFVSGYISASNGDVVRVYAPECDYSGDYGTSYVAMTIYDANKTKLNTKYVAYLTLTDDGHGWSHTLGSDTNDGGDSIAYIRIGGQPADATGVVVTLNEAITGYTISAEEISTASIITVNEPID